MKKNILLITIAVCIFVSCKNDKNSKYHTLIVKKDYCVIDDDGLVFLPEFYLKKDNKVIDTFKTEIHEDYYEIDSIKSGSYSIEFNSIYKLLEVEKIKLLNQKRDTITLCLDKISYDSINHTPFIDRLNDNEYLEIFVSTQGCFINSKGKMILSKINDEIIVKVNDKEKKLTLGEIEYIRNFELELVNMNHGGCTTIETYTIKYNDEVLKITDGSCKWYGFGRLYNLLFNE